jgi:hypothetical protein
MEKYYYLINKVELRNNQKDKKHNLIRKKKIIFKNKDSGH